MNTIFRYVIAFLLATVALHYTVTLFHDDYARATSLASLFKAAPLHDAPSTIVVDILNETLPIKSIDPGPRANASFVILARNSDLNGIVSSVSQMESRFNWKYQYPYVFLNDEPFTEQFKIRLSLLSNATMEFGQVPREQWVQPDWVDEERATAGRKKLVDEKVIYGGSVSYRNMCRFNSGFFFKHELLQKYRWYWRIEPGVRYHCDLNYDPFLYMQEHNKTYGFTMTMYEFQATIPTLWNHALDFAKANPQYIDKNNSMGYLSDDSGITYNLCHFWSNFEIADMDFWRGESYQAFFEYLDKQGGFYYERWGDAPVHSIAVALMLPKDRIHFFKDIGYTHQYYFPHCPLDPGDWARGKCNCSRQNSFDYHRHSCLRQWERIQ